MFQKMSQSMSRYRKKNFTCYAFVIADQDNYITIVEQEKVHDFENVLLTC